MTSSIINILALDDQLEVEWADGHQYAFGFFWLRDNAKDESSFDIRSNQRELFTAGLPFDIKPISADLEADQQAIAVRWPDIDAVVCYKSDMLYRESIRSLKGADIQGRKVWGASKGAQQFTLDSLLKERPSAGMSLVKALHADGFALINDCPAEKGSVNQIASFLGYVRETIFGGVWEFEADGDMADSAYTSKALRPHTDGSYSFDAPGAQILLCVENDAEGGKSIIVDGYKIAEQMKREHPGQYADLARLDVEGVYAGDGVELRARRPTFREDSQGNLVQVTFNNYDRSELLYPEPQMNCFYQALQTFDLALNDSANQWTHQLTVGQALVFDNWRMLHGRTAFSGNRKMTGAYTNREDLESRIRLLTNC